MNSGQQLSGNLKQNIQYVKNILHPMEDLAFHSILLPSEPSVEGCLIRLKGISDDAKVTEEILHPILLSGNIPLKRDFLKKLTKQILASDLSLGFTSKEAVQSILEGHTVLLIDGYQGFIDLETSGGEHRPVEEPSSQLVIRGPKESFNETIRTNAALIRRRLKTPHLKLEELHVGKIAGTKVNIMYLDNKVNKETLRLVRSRLTNNEANITMESGYLERILEDHQITLFPTINNTERPDEAASSLLAGRIALLIDGTPFVLLCPASFKHYFQSPEDLYQSNIAGKLILYLRYLSFFLSLFAPAIYVGMVTHHQALIPTSLLISLYSQREGVPFPAIVEVLLMEVTFEILREAGVRLPRAIGQAVSIVGALVIGQTAVQAGIVSTAVVIVVSITAISSFTLPNYSLAITARIVRFILMFVTYFLGYYGLILATFILLGHLYHLTTLGTPYMAKGNQAGEEGGG
ncbi:spore germination protein [Bacillus mangrovi]|uniref:Spore germination protein n=1 Tax=Metabacillus mangrovi TaxID=1491830 RepID=A0A7X2S581_9BACI|nr:spore germination protein [Metabacillus mangrovi]MTH53470.1 spore germination protein [Metabacillus mangrovi]